MVQTKKRQTQTKTQPKKRQTQTKTQTKKRQTQTKTQPKKRQTQTKTQPKKQSVADTQIQQTNALLQQIHTQLETAPKKDVENKKKDELTFWTRFTDNAGVYVEKLYNTKKEHRIGAAMPLYFLAGMAHHANQWSLLSKAVGMLSKLKFWGKQKSPSPKYSVGHISQTNRVMIKEVHLAAIDYVRRPFDMIALHRVLRLLHKHKKLVIAMPVVIGILSIYLRKRRQLFIAFIAGEIDFQQLWLKVLDDYVVFFQAKTKEDMKKTSMAGWWTWTGLKERLSAWWSPKPEIDVELLSDPTDLVGSAVIFAVMKKPDDREREYTKRRHDETQMIRDIYANTMVNDENGEEYLKYSELRNRMAYILDLSAHRLKESKRDHIATKAIYLQPFAYIAEYINTLVQSEMAWRDILEKEKNTRFNLVESNMSMFSIVKNFIFTPSEHKRILFRLKNPSAYRKYLIDYGEKLSWSDFRTLFQELVISKPFNKQTNMEIQHIFTHSNIIMRFMWYYTQFIKSPVKIIPYLFDKEYKYDLNDFVKRERELNQTYRDKFDKKMRDEEENIANEPDEGIKMKHLNDIRKKISESIHKEKQQDKKYMELQKDLKGYAGVFMHKKYISKVTDVTSLIEQFKIRVKHKMQKFSKSMSFITKLRYYVHIIKSLRYIKDKDFDGLLTWYASNPLVQVTDTKRFVDTMKKE